MSGLIFVVLLTGFIFVMIGNATKNAKKKQDQAKRNAQKPQSMQNAAQAAAQGNRAGNGKQAPRAKKPAAAVHEGEDPCHDHLYTGEYRPFQGFNEQSGFGEGADPCHDGLQPIRVYEDEIPAEELLPGERESREWLRGVVLSEILAKPVSQRKR